MTSDHPGIKSWFFSLALLLLVTTSANGSQNQCLHCHEDMLGGQQVFHSLNCVTCHSGNDQSQNKALAHKGLIAFPGNLSNANKTCGQCHTEHTKAVHQHLMATARGMVETTRRVLEDGDDGAHILELGHSKSDSLMRKLCAGCHLARDKDTHTHSTLNRGGGCLACHLDDYPSKGHVQLTSNISDARCFGCHSRSGRVSLNYSGLAELDEIESAFIKQKARLPDGRLVQIKTSDVHHQSGMSCIDCHTGQGLMGIDSSGQRSSRGIDIQCGDCHFDGVGSTEKFNTRLEHLSTHSRPVSLRLKNSNAILQVPRYTSSSHTLSEEHARLSCDACHSQWAPQCYGCHISYDKSGSQYDYLEKSVTAGRWKEKRWMTLSGLPPLGVDKENRIRPFVPGMIFTLEHPELKTPMKKRLFSPLAPHTIGKSRSCQSCHCDSHALGLGSGKFTRPDDTWAFTPTLKPMEDGIPEDAWHSWDKQGEGSSTQPGARPFNPEEIQRILGAGIRCQ